MRDPTHYAAADWADPGKVDEYVRRVGRLPARLAGESVLVDALPGAPRRILDLGCGDGRVTALVLAARPSVVDAIAIDRSPPMLKLARQRFAHDPRVTLVGADLAERLTLDGPFDAIVSGFAIHHLTDERKRGLFGEMANVLADGGSFLNLEVVASATPQLHATFLAAIGRTHDDPDDHLAPVDLQLQWMREAGLVQVDCLWRWRGFALLAGEAPTR